MKRRDFLKGVSLIAAGSALSGPLANAAGIIPSPAEASPLPRDDDFEPVTGLSPVRALDPEVSRPISVIIIGCGNRGRTYAGYARKFPKGMKVVGVSDILEHRANYLGDQHNVPQEMRFGHFREVFEGGKKLADAVVIATPDDRHYEPCMKALALGYDVLLEKPVAPTAKECKAIREMTKKTGRVVAVCHVLRYAPYFMALREVVRSGVIGDVVNIQHMEPIQYAHMAHSYVRGNWRREDETTPIILAKSCHDLDILRWIIDKPCKHISAEGWLSFFKAENAPEGALDVDLAKANHHGRDSSTSVEWAEATTPRVVFSATQPMKTTYTRYSKVGARVYTEYMDDYVRVVTDGYNCEVTASAVRLNDPFAVYNQLVEKIWPGTF